MARKRYQKTFIKFLEYSVSRTLTFLLMRLPFPWRARLLQNLSLIFGRLAGEARQRVGNHLQLAFPNESEAWRRDIATKHFRILGRMGAEFLQNPFVDDDFLEKWFVLKPDAETHRRIYADGGILILGHLGNWEWKGVAITRNGGDLFVLAKRQSNPWSNAWIERMRGSQDIRLIYTDESPRRILKLLKQKAVIGFIADQDAGKNGKFIDFFGRPASTFQGPAAFARLSDAPLYFLWSYHDEQDRLVYEIQEFPRPDFDHRPDPEAWDAVFTKTWVNMLEEKVKQHPQDYFWLHRRWHTRPPGETESTPLL